VIVDRLWRYCSVLRDDGLSYPDYVEQLTYLLFLKMAHEQAEVAPQRSPIVPVEFGWTSLITREGEDLRRHYSATLSALGSRPGMLGVIFRHAENKIRDPAKLRLLIADLIDKRSWSALDVDVKGDAYEGLLEKNAQDTKSGAGQYFTPRPLVRAIVKCVQPQLGERVHDPACGTGGFLLAAHEYIRNTNPTITEVQDRHLRLEAISGTELVDAVTRLGSMNLLLHGVGPATAEEGAPPILTADALATAPVRGFDVVLSNPPFGMSGGTMIVTKRSERSRQGVTIVREDFHVSTSNKQLGFLQHIGAILNKSGRAAVVLPDNVLSGGGASAAVRRWLLNDFELHTLLRLPAGLFYASGVRANVLFFDRPTGERRIVPTTEKVWIYDLRVGMHFSLNSNPLRREDLDEFVSCYRVGNRARRTPTWSEHSNPDGRWRAYTYEEIASDKECSLDIRWLRTQDAEQGAESLNEMAGEIMRDLETVMGQVSALMAMRLGPK
jgi:type I restriction enzyme M protein